MFPTVEEYLLLDVLSNSDNNVQKAADKLVKMGYVKRDTPSKTFGLPIICFYMLAKYESFVIFFIMIKINNFL